jgi:hypothetical protein
MDTLLLWPKDVIAVLLGEQRASIDNMVPLGSFVATYYYLGGRSPGTRWLASYLAGGIGAVAFRQGPFMSTASPYRKLAVKKFDPDVSGPGDSSIGGVTGPLSNDPLRPIQAFEAMPPIPRYPFGASGMYALNQERGWTGGMSPNPVQML